MADAPVGPDRAAGEPEHAPLHAPDRRLDAAFAALTAIGPGSFLHCLEQRADPTELPPMLQERLPHARWIPSDTHALTYVDPSDHLEVHRCWLEACHGPDRVGRTRVRTTRALLSDDGDAPGPVGLYDVVLIDLIGTEGIDAVVVGLTPVSASDQASSREPAPRGSASFRLRLDTDGTIVGGTESVAGLLGRELQGLLGTPVLPLIHPDDLDAASGVWEDVLSKPDQSQTVRIRLLHADGSWRWFSDTAWNALDDPDSPGILSEFHDIHTLVEAELALHASELSFRTLAESLPVGVAVLDQHGRVRFANHRLVTLLLDAGLAGPGSDAATHPPPTGPGFSTLWTDLVAPQLSAEVEDLVAPGDPGGGAPVSRQVELLGHDGRTIDLLVQSVTIWNDDGRSVIVSLQDVSDEVQIGRAHARLVQVVDEVADLVLVAQLDGVISYVNQAARGYMGRDAIGQPLRRYLRPEVRQLIQDAVVPALRWQAGWSGDIDIAHPDGSTRTMATTVSPAIGPGTTDQSVGITMRDVTAERAHERELARLARQDALTDLPNRFALMELLETWTAEAEATQHLAVFFIDVDNLKIVNDGLGHSAGDQLLVAVAEELRRVAGADRVARFGGDEFVVVSRTVPPDQIAARADEFLAAVERAEVDGVSNHVSASIGVAMALGASASPERLIRDADAAMYAAKRAGRSRAALFDATLRKQVTRRFELEAELRHAIAHDGLGVHLQPIVHLETGEVTGLEALCRWDDVSPGEFIPIAEESGLIVPLGAAVLSRALAELHVLTQALPHLDAPHIGINVSARELDLPDFADRALEIIAAGPVPVSQVVLELTESVLIDPREEVDATLRRLKDAGVTLALDDFGIGYSSLAYLRRYPLDILKLDISYTQAMVTDPETRVIVESVVSMANRLGLRVVAEGIETAEQLAAVHEVGARWAQGYLVGRPASVEALIADGLAPRTGRPRP